MLNAFPARAPFAALVIIHLAACTDAPTTSATRPPPGVTARTGATPNVLASSLRSDGPRVTVLIRVADAGGAWRGGATARFAAHNQLVDVADGGAADIDSRIGHIAANLPVSGAPAAEFGACLVAPPHGYALPAASCRSEDYDNNATISLGTVTVLKRPTLVVAFLNASYGPVAGGAAHVTGPNGYSATAVNGGTSPMLPAAGAYTVCETARPTGYRFTNPVCRQVNAQWGLTHILQLTHSLAISPGKPPFGPPS